MSVNPIRVFRIGTGQRGPTDATIVQHFFRSRANTRGSGLRGLTESPLESDGESRIGQSTPEEHVQQQKDPSQETRPHHYDEYLIEGHTGER